MKISKATKSTVDASNDIDHLANISAKSKEDAYKHVKAAIDCLASCDKSDEHAKESIANLSVVALSLK